MIACWFLTGLALRAAEIPFPSALDGEAVVECRLSDINREGLVLGNGDLKGLLWDREGTLCVRVTKNDLWDARVDTSQDPPMLRVDIPNQKWSGGGNPPSYAKPYPQPRCAAVIVIGDAAAPAVWRSIRAGGEVNEWRRQGDVGLMAVAGPNMVSAGYRHDFPPAGEASFTALKFRISGNAGAQYYVNIFARTGEPLVESGWIDSPSHRRRISFAIPAGSRVGAVEFYVQSKTGARAENRIRDIIFQGVRRRWPFFPAWGIRGCSRPGSTSAARCSRGAWQRQGGHNRTRPGRSKCLSH